MFLELVRDYGYGLRAASGVVSLLCLLFWFRSIFFLKNFDTKHGVEERGLEGVDHR